MVSKSIHFLGWLRSDARHFQILAQWAFLLFGIAALGWNNNVPYYLVLLSTALATQWVFIFSASLPLHSLKSAAITGLGLCLLFKTNSLWLCAAAATLAIGQKFVFRVGKQHLWNPANFGIVAVVVLSGEGWISPGQWGSGPLLVFIVGSLGLAVLSKVKRLDTAFYFLFTFAALEAFRQVGYLGWGWDVWWHKISSGSLWLFALFMITDPMTSPLHPVVRAVWAIAVATASFILIHFYFIPVAPMWVLFFATPVVPWLNKKWSRSRFMWRPETSGSASKKIIYTP